MPSVSLSRVPKPSDVRFTSDGFLGFMEGLYGDYLKHKGCFGIYIGVIQRLPV